MQQLSQKNGFTLIDQSARRGFTLIELSIVLIIIGLITSGILIGRDLIHAAEIRATVKQAEEFNAAANTFKTKYNCLPGDCAKAADFGFDAATNGTGDDHIGCAAENMLCAGDANVPQSAEYVNFWYHLSAAGLIAFKGAPYDASDPWQRTGIVSPPVRAATLSDPSMSHAAAAGWSVSNNLILQRVGGSDARPAHNFLINYRARAVAFDVSAFLPLDVYALDAKLDDGLPLSGSVLAWQAFTLVGGTYTTLVRTTDSSADSCVNVGTVPASYNVQSTDASSYTARCSPAIKASF